MDAAESRCIWCHRDLAKFRCTRCDLGFCCREHFVESYRDKTTSWHAKHCKELGTMHRCADEAVAHIVKKAERGMAIGMPRAESELEKRKAENEAMPETLQEILERYLEEIKEGERDRAATEPPHVGPRPLLGRDGIMMLRGYLAAGKHNIFSVITGEISRGMEFSDYLDRIVNPILESRRTFERFRPETLQHFGFRGKVTFNAATGDAGRLLNEFELLRAMHVVSEAVVLHIASYNYYRHLHAITLPQLKQILVTAWKDCNIRKFEFEFCRFTRMYDNEADRWNPDEKMTAITVRLENCIDAPTFVLGSFTQIGTIEFFSTISPLIGISIFGDALDHGELICDRFRFELSCVLDTNKDDLFILIREILRRPLVWVNRVDTLIIREIFLDDENSDIHPFVNETLMLINESSIEPILVAKLKFSGIDPRYLYVMRTILKLFEPRNVLDILVDSDLSREDKLRFITQEEKEVWDQSNRLFPWKSSPRSIKIEDLSTLIDEQTILRMLQHFILRDPAGQTREITVPTISTAVHWEFLVTLMPNLESLSVSQCLPPPHSIKTLTKLHTLVIRHNCPEISEFFSRLPLGLGTCRVATCSNSFDLATIPRSLPNLRELTVVCDDWCGIRELEGDADKVDYGTLLATHAATLHSMDDLRRHTGYVTAEPVDLVKATNFVVRLLRDISSPSVLETFSLKINREFEYASTENSIAFDALDDAIRGIPPENWPRKLIVSCDSLATSLTQLNGGIKPFVALSRTFAMCRKGGTVKFSIGGDPSWKDDLRLSDKKYDTSKERAPKPPLRCMAKRLDITGSFAIFHPDILYACLRGLRFPYLKLIELRGDCLKRGDIISSVLYLLLSAIQERGNQMGSVQIRVREGDDDKPRNLSSAYLAGGNFFYGNDKLRALIQGNPWLLE